MIQSQTQILIIDLGSQYTEVIRRSLRYLGFHSVIVPPRDVSKWLTQNDKNLRGIILSGGSASVYDHGAPTIPDEILVRGMPVLGICYGMQWLAYVHDKKSIHHAKGGKSYGPVEINLAKRGNSKLFKGLSGKINAWASHGDSVKVAPKGFRVVATSHSGKVIESMEHAKKKLYAVQFHPEVEQTEDENKILENFARLCGAKVDYHPKDIIREIGENTKRALAGGTAIIGVSGGVDSTTLAAILTPVLGKQLKAFFIDTGGMRKGETKKVLSLAERAGVKLEVIDQYKDRFITSVGGSIDAEEKRARFRTVYGEVFQEVAQKYKATHMIQGTLATDLIESGKAGGSALIKTHHNVGLSLGLKEVSPLSDFFKFEIRQMAQLFKLDELLSGRQPFPGPGLYLRVVGVPVTRERLEIVREADDEVMKILKRHKIYDRISQCIVALLGVDTVGVKGDGRVYGHSLVVRTVETTDFMTVKGYHLAPEICDEITSALVKHPQIVRVLFDLTPKPPATTEFE